MIINIDSTCREAIARIAADPEGYIKDFFEKFHLFDLYYEPLSLPDGDVEIEVNISEPEAKIAYAGFLERVEKAKKENDLRGKEPLRYD